MRREAYIIKLVYLAFLNNVNDCQQLQISRVFSELMTLEGLSQVEYSEKIASLSEDPSFDYFYIHSFATEPNY